MSGRGGCRGRAWAGCRRTGRAGWSAQGRDAGRLWRDGSRGLWAGLRRRQAQRARAAECGEHLADRGRIREQGAHGEPAPAADADAKVDLECAFHGSHFRTIAAAVGAAPAGATIAVEAGTYVEKVVLGRRAVNIIGRCSDKVVMQQATGVLGSAIEAASGDDFLLENVTLRGYNAAIAVLGGKAKLDSLVIEDGLLAGVVAGNAGTDVHLRNVVVRGMKPRAGATEAFGIFASAGSSVTIDDSVLSGHDYANIGVTKLDTTLSLSRSIVRDGRPLAARRSSRESRSGARWVSSRRSRPRPAE
jgi:hypothetical protein